MNITKIYTKTMHKALQNALKMGNNSLEYNPQGGFIRLIRSAKNGVTFIFNTRLPCRFASSKISFLVYKYEDIIADLQECYNTTQTDGTYALESEFYQSSMTIRELK